MSQQRQPEGDRSRHWAMTPSGAARLREVATGRVFDFTGGWADARRMVDGGGYAFVAVASTRADRVSHSLEAPLSPRSIRELAAGELTARIRAEPVRRRP